MRIIKNKIFGIVLTILIFFFQLSGECAQLRPVGLLISSEIKPFMMMVKGFEAAIDRPSIRIFFDKKGLPYSKDPMFSRFDSSAFSAVVAVGPRALSFMDKKKWKSPLFYSMVLNPREHVSKGADLCGISLNIFSLNQFSMIHIILPEVRRIGVIYNPENNQKWFDSASVFAKIKGITLIPLLVAQESDVRGLFMKKPKIDALLFIPDATVISRSLIRYIIKKSYLYSIPAIGYNRFFHESGCAVSFDIDYTAVGVQTAKVVELFFEKKECRSLGPDYKILVNEKVVKTLGVKMPGKLPGNVKVD